MSIYDVMVLILMKNKGSHMHYENDADEFVITFKEGPKLIPAECWIKGRHIYNKKTKEIVCQFRCE